MITIEIEMTLDNEDIDCWGEQTFEVSFDGYYKTTIEGLFFNDRDITHLSTRYYDTIIDCILEHHQGEAEQRGEEMMELERGN